MSDTIIRVDRLSKRYQIGAREKAAETFGGALAGWAAAPVRNFRNLKQLGDGVPDGADAIWALRDASFDVSRGEVIGIVGRNGSGKSTLLKILSRITEPTSGSVVIRGRVSSLLEVGTGFHPDLTGRENVYLNGTLLGMTRAEVDHKFDEVVAFSGVERFIDTPVKRYSSGMQVRLAFAVAAHLEPEVLIVDEVLAVGDAEFQAKCLGKMRDVSQQGGRTVLFVSHNMSAVRRLCTRALLLDAGRIAFAGSTSEAIERYLRSGADADRLVTYPESSAPESDELRVESVAIRDVAGSTESPLTTADALAIEIGYWIKRPIQDLRVVVNLLSGDGTEVFSTSDFWAQPAHRLRAEGRYVSRCRIPGNLLTSGNYIVVVDFDVPRLRAILTDLRVTFSLPELSTNQLGFTVAERPPGVVHPVLDWSVEPADVSV